MVPSFDIFDCLTSLSFSQQNEKCDVTGVWRDELKNGHRQALLLSRTGGLWDCYSVLAGFSNNFHLNFFSDEKRKKHVTESFFFSHGQLHAWKTLLWRRNFAITHVVFLTGSSRSFNGPNLGITKGWCTFCDSYPVGLYFQLKKYAKKSKIYEQWLQKV